MIAWLWHWCRVGHEVVADAFEALVGAVYIENGLQVASKFVLSIAEVVHCACIRHADWVTIKRSMYA